MIFFEWKSNFDKTFVMDIAHIKRAKWLEKIEMQ